MSTTALIGLALAPICLFAAELRSESFPVSISIDAGKTQGELRPIWRFFGYDEPNYTYTPNGKKLLGEIAEFSKPQTVYVRTHNLLCTGDGTAALKWGSTNAYTEDAQGNAVYDWAIVDRIIDTYVERGMKPYMQIGFMPKVLATKPDPYQHNWKPGDQYATIVGGWAYPPKDYDKWRELCRQWVLHCIQKYGKAEVESWYWEVWNEADIMYWQGTPQEFHKTHDYAIDGVRSALPTARVGGPDAAGGGRWLRDFFEHCVRGTNYATGKVGTPLDFVAFHAKGAPRLVDGRVQMGISAHLRTMNEKMGIVASFPELKNTPIVIGESDPDGCAACAASVYPQNAYRNTSLFASYTAASFARKRELAERHGVNLEGVLTWSFAFEGFPYFMGFRSLATNGIDKPVLNVFRMFAMMSGQRLAVSSDAAVSLDEMIRRGVRGERPDVHALASLDGRKLCVMVWHYHDDDVAGPDAATTLSLENLPGSDALKLTHYRIDNEHSNSYEFWKKLGSPQQPTPEQYEQLEQAGQLQTLGQTGPVKVADGSATVAITLPRQAVSLLVFEWP